MEGDVRGDVTDDVSTRTACRAGVWISRAGLLVAYLGVSGGGGPGDFTR